MSAAPPAVAPYSRPMLHALAQSWWLVLLRGIAGILFGVLAFAWPGLTLVTLVLFYGVYALIDGAFALAAAFTGVVVARRRCAGVDLSHRRLGDRARDIRDHWRDSVAQRNRQRMVADLGRRGFGDLRINNPDRAGCGRAGARLGRRRLLDRVRRDAGRPVVSAAQPSYRFVMRTTAKSCIACST